MQSNHQPLRSGADVPLVHHRPQLPEAMQVFIDRVRLSDLFFNHQHDNYELALRVKDAPELQYVSSSEPVHDALLIDAKEFLSQLTGHRPDDDSMAPLAQALADDFMERL